MQQLRKAGWDERHVFNLSLLLAIIEKTLTEKQKISDYLKQVQQLETHTAILTFHKVPFGD